MREKFSVPVPDNDNKPEMKRSVEERQFTTEFDSAFDKIAKFRKIVESSDLLVTEKEEFLEKIDKILDALFNSESAPGDALSRVAVLAPQYKFQF